MRTIASSPRLQSLEIHDAPITDAGLAHLEYANSLRAILLGSAQTSSSMGNRIAISGDGFAHLAGLPSLEEIEIHSESLTGRGLEHLGSLRRLKRLRLKGGAFTDDDLRHLAKLAKLESLEIMSSGIDGTGLRHLKQLPNLSYVCLEGPNITDEVVPHLAALPSLESVMIYGTMATAAGLEGFHPAPKLKHLGLIPAVPGDTKSLKRALPNVSVLNGGKGL